MVGILKLLLITSILNFVFYILFIMSLKGKSPNKILVMSLTLTVVVITFLSFVLYLNGTSFEDIGNKNSYVLGQISSIKNGEIGVRVIQNNIKINDNYITIKYDSSMEVFEKYGVFERKASTSNFSIGDVVSIYCGENKIQNDCIIAQKITIK